MNDSFFKLPEEKLCTSDVDAEEMEHDLIQMIEFWKSVYYRKEQE